MCKIALEKLKNYLPVLLCAAGMNRENAELAAEVYMKATLRGVGHHDVNDLPSRLENYIAGRVKVNPDFRLTGKYNALEHFDGDNGPGELCCCHIIERGMEMAEEYGIAFCTIHNSNHFLSAAPYVEKAAEKGYLAMLYTRTHPTVNAPGDSRKVIGSSPMGFAAATKEGYPLLLDICLAYASYGQLKAKKEKGEKMSDYWGFDSAGHPTEEPGDILSGGTPSPVGGHKGFGLSILTEILTGVLSGGEIIDERGPGHDNGFGVYSQSVIVIKTEGFLHTETFAERTSRMIHRMRHINPDIRMPGQSSWNSKNKMEEEGYVRVAQQTLDDINRLAAGLGIALLQ